MTQVQRWRPFPVQSGPGSLSLPTGWQPAGLPVFPGQVGRERERRGGGRREEGGRKKRDRDFFLQEGNLAPHRISPRARSLLPGDTGITLIFIYIFLLSPAGRESAIRPQIPTEV